MQTIRRYVEVQEARAAGAVDDEDRAGRTLHDGFRKESHG